MTITINSLVPFHQIKVESDSVSGKLSRQKFSYLLISEHETGLDAQESLLLENNPSAKGRITRVLLLKESSTKKSLELLGDEQFHIVVYDGSDEGVKEILAWLKSRDESVLQNGGHLFVSSFVDLETIKEPQRDRNLSIIPVLEKTESVAPQKTLGSDKEKKESGNGSSTTELSTSIKGKYAAAFAAIIGKYGEVEPARPFQTLEVSGIQPKYAPRFLDKGNLLDKRYCAWGVEDGKVKIERIVTTDFDNTDVSYRDLNSKLILSYLIYDLKAFLKAKFPRYMLSEDSKSSGDVVTPKVLSGYIVGRHNLWLEHNLVQDPQESFSKNLIVQIDKNEPGRVLLDLSVQLMGQLRQTVSTLKFKL
jgi:phage tail sheath gpL-like